MHGVITGNLCKCACSLMFLKFWGYLSVGNTLNFQVLDCLIHCNLSNKASRMCFLSCSETDCPRPKKNRAWFRAGKILQLQKFYTNLKCLLAGLIWVFMLSEWLVYRQFNYLISAV